MPGSVSDSYDPEFSTGANAAEVRNAVEVLRDELSAAIGKPAADILEVVRGGPCGLAKLRLSIRECRILRFAVNRALDSL